MGVARKGLWLLLTTTGALLMLSHTMLTPTVDTPRQLRAIRQQHKETIPNTNKLPPEPTTRNPLQRSPPSAAPTKTEYLPPDVLPHLALPGALEYRNCTPSTTHNPTTRALDLIVEPDAAEWPVNCEGREDVCEAVKKFAINRELIVALCNSAVKGQLEKWIDANRRAGIKNMLIISMDDALPAWLEERNVGALARPERTAGSHKISAQKFKFVREFLTVGCSLIMSDIDVVYVQNPFDFLRRDADIEGTTDGWDDLSAYGWMEQLDDPSLGKYGRHCPGMRITAWNSGLWYARATKASQRLMVILAYRMENEPNTWDQAAFGEEVARPARDGHHAAGITKRALNYWCFANSKTIFRRLRVEPGLQDHRPVVVHANYHQPKEPRMRAVYDRWHLGEPDALKRFNDPMGTVPATTLEANFLHSINDGFVSGANLKDGLEASAGGCAPRPSKHGVQVAPLHLTKAARVADCAADDPLCAAAASLARDVAHNEFILVVASASEATPLKLLLESAAKAGVAPRVLVLATDDELSGLLASSGVSAGAVVAVSNVPSLSGVGELNAKWEAIDGLLAYGYSVLSLHPTTVLLSDPFAALYRDADMEVMSLGWDDPSAYGYNHIIDDPSMGFTRFCHGSRIVGYEPRVFYARATVEARALARRMVKHLTAPASALPSEDGLERVEREALTQELWLPSRNEETYTGAIPRVMNYMCFVNSKVLYRQLGKLRQAKPVLASINYHTDAEARMKAAISTFYDGSEELAKLPAADTRTTGAAQMAADGACDAKREYKDSDGASAIGRRVVELSPWSWGGQTGFEFQAGGKLVTAWGDGAWGVLEGVQGGVFADFIGSKHNVQLAVDEEGPALAISTRCADHNIVLLRSVKGVKLAE